MHLSPLQLTLRQFVTGKHDESDAQCQVRATRTLSLTSDYHQIKYNLQLFILHPKFNTIEHTATARAHFVCQAKQYHLSDASNCTYKFDRISILLLDL
jgi:hypothetical protein